MSFTDEQMNEVWLRTMGWRCLNPETGLPASSVNDLRVALRCYTEPLASDRTLRGFLDSAASFAMPAGLRAACEAALATPTAKYNTHHGEHGHFATTSGGSGGMAGTVAGGGMPSGPDGETEAVDYGARGMMGLFSVPDKTPERALVREKATEEQMKQQTYRGGVKSKLVTEISNRIRKDAEATETVTGFDHRDADSQEALEARVGRLVNGWAATSGDHDPNAVSVQLSAAKEFGLKDAEATIRKLTPKTVMDDVKTLQDGYGDAERVMLRNMYDSTQARLKRGKIKELTLYRGVSYVATDIHEHPEMHHKDGPNRVKFNPISSWTADPSVAISFASEKDHGYVFTAKIPASHILSTARTGLGCLEEWEYTVLGQGTNVGSVKVWGGSGTPTHKYNTHHGEHGHFASTSGSSAGSVTGIGTHIDLGTFQNAETESAAHHGIAAIHAVLPGIALGATTKRVHIVGEPEPMGGVGSYTPEPPSVRGKHDRIRIGLPVGDKTEMEALTHADAAVTVAHELGHYLDKRALHRTGDEALIDNPQAYASREGSMHENKDHPLHGVMRAIDNSQGTTDLYNKRGIYNRQYLLSSHEQFARAFSQYIALRSGDKAMQGEIGKRVAKQGQWKPADFEPIARELDAYFDKLGWRGAQ